MNQNVESLHSAKCPAVSADVRCKRALTCCFDSRSYCCHYFGRHILERKHQLLLSFAQTQIGRASDCSLDFSMATATPLAQD